jgi:hypothetical protein
MKIHSVFTKEELMERFKENDIPYKEGGLFDDLYFMIQTHEDFNDFIDTCNLSDNLLVKVGKFRKFKIKKMKMNFDEFSKLYEQFPNEAIQKLFQRFVSDNDMVFFNKFLNIQGNTIKTYFLLHKISPLVPLLRIAKNKSTEEYVEIARELIRSMGCDPEEIFHQCLVYGTPFIDEEDYKPFVIKREESEKEEKLQTEEMPSPPTPLTKLDIKNELAKNRIHLEGSRWLRKLFFLITSPEELAEFIEGYDKKSLFSLSVIRYQTTKLKRNQMTFDEFVRLYAMDKKNAVEQLLQTSLDKKEFDKFSNFLKSGQSIRTFFLLHKLTPSAPIFRLLNTDYSKDVLATDIWYIQKLRCDPDEIYNHAIEYGTLFFDKADFLPFQKIEEGEIESDPSELVATYREIKQKERKGQSKFRENVLKAYDYQCAITGEKCLDVVESAHLIPFINEKSNEVSNGIPLRVDFHRLFDKGFLAIDENYKIKMSGKIVSEYYRSYHGKTIHLPLNKKDYPSLKSIEFRKEMFGG